MKRETYSIFHHDVNKKIIHAINYNGDDRTLCGLALEGSCDATLDGWSKAKNSDKRITCNNCIDIIDFCKSIKSTDIYKEG